MAMTRGSWTAPKPPRFPVIDATEASDYKAVNWRRVSRRLTISVTSKIAFMANTTSARKASRKIARRTEINKARRSRMRGEIRKVEEAIASGDRTKAQEAMKAAEPALMRAAQQGQVHKNAASRKVSRLTRQITKLGK